MANCLWHLAVLAFVVIAASHRSGAAVVPEGETFAGAEIIETTEGSVPLYQNPAFMALQSMIDVGVEKIASSFSDVEEAAEGMMDNVEEYFTRMLRQIGDDAKEFKPHLKEFYNAIPPKAYQKLVLDCLRTLLKQTQDHCGKTLLEHNPIHPGLKLDVSRAKRSAERMTLAKFGESLSTWMTTIDKFVVDYLTKAIPVTCPIAENWISELIQRVELITPEKFKADW